MLYKLFFVKELWSPSNFHREITREAKNPLIEAKA